MSKLSLLATVAALAIIASPVMAQNTNTNQNKNVNKLTSNTTVGVTTSATTGPISIQSGNDQQPGGISVPSPSAGFCGGISGGFAIGAPMFSIGASAGFVEEDCALDRHISIGMSDPVTRPIAEQDWIAMENRLMKRNAQGTSGTQQGYVQDTTPPAAAQVADASAAACNSALPKVQLAMCEAKR